MRWVVLVATWSSFFVWSTLGSAQSAPETNNAASAEEEIVVTGTRIRRSAFSASAPVDVIGQSQLQQSGVTNLADVVTNLTSSQGSGYQGAGNSTTASSGTVAVNLRGLGTGSTLVLLNGRRLVPSGAGTSQHFGDLSVIPLAAVDRIEVLKGGGAAVYGADAVGGVVNIVTRRNWEGARVDVNGQSTTRYDQRDLTVSGAWGASSERSRLLVSMSHLDRSELTAEDRDFTAGTTISEQGNPGTFIVPGLDPSDPTHIRYPDPGCASAPGSAVVPQMVNGVATANATCTMDFGPFRSMLGNLQRTNLFGSAEYDVSDYVTTFGEVLASRMRTDGISSPSYPALPLLYVPADHVDNPFGLPAVFLGRPLGAASGPTRNTASDDTLRVLAGIKGRFSPHSPNTLLSQWQWEAVVSYGVSTYASSIADNLREPLQAALFRCSDPSNLAGCFNPFYSAIDGTGTTNSDAVIASFAGTYHYITEHSLQTYDLNLTGPILGLPWGDIGLAFGGQLRRESRSTDADHDAEQERYGFLLGNSDGSAKRSIHSGYLEVLVPLYYGLDLQGALRVEHYSDIDSTAMSPFAGITFNPAQMLGQDQAPNLLRQFRFKAQATSAFRAPTVFQSAPVYSIIPTTLTVAGAAAPIYIPVQSFGNPDLEPERALVLSAGLDWRPISDLSLTVEFWSYRYGNRIVTESAAQAIATDENLRTQGGSNPQVIRDATGNIERVQVSNVNIDGTVITRGLDFGAQFTITGASFGGQTHSWGALTLGAHGTFTMSYSFPEIEAGPRTIAGTYPLKSLPPLHCKKGRCEAAGSRNVKNFAPPLPRLRLNLPVHWEFAGNAITLIGHYTSGIEDDNEVDNAGNLGEVAALFTLDAQYAYRLSDVVGESLELTVGVFNLLDQAPPRASEISGYEPLLYDPRQRMMYAKLTGQF